MARFSELELVGAVRSIKSKVGKWTAFERWKALDPAMTRDTWQSAWSAGVAAITQGALEVTRPLNRRPVGGEILTRRPEESLRFVQYATVFVRDPETGATIGVPSSIRTDTLRSRLSVVNETLANFQAASQEGGTFDGQEVLYARYSGTIQFGS